MKKVLTSFCILMLSLFFFACSASSDYMIKTDRSDNLKLAPQKSRIVFIRPSSAAFGLAPIIIDENGKYVGESIPKSYFFSDLNPGENTFIVWGEGTHSLKANLKPGKTYYVEITPHMGAWAARFHLDSIKKDSPKWKEKDQWMKEIPFYLPNVTDGQSIVDKKGKDDIKSTIEKGKKRHAEYSAEEKKEKTLFPEDGE